MNRCRRVHHKKDTYDVFIARPSKWGSPFSYKKNSTAPYKVSNRKESIEKHKEWLLNGDGQYLLKDLHELKGKVLGCWCNENQSCHGDILVKLVNDLDKEPKVGLESILL
jgi:hypothetical protein